MNFKVGQKICCVNPVEGLVKDKVYTVDFIGGCPKCKTNWVGVGITQTCPIGSWGQCATCGHRMPRTKESVNKRTFKASRFAPIIENTSTADIANQIFETCNDVKEIKIPSLV